MSASGPSRFDSLVIVSFGGPERAEDVIPFLENVLRGRNVPRERMLAVAEHYYEMGGASPINAQNRELAKAIEALLDRSGPRLPVYFGNRNWHPFLSDTLAMMAADGRRRALALVTSAYSSYSGCRQYLENITEARRTVGPSAPEIEKLRVFYNHPAFVEAIVSRTRDALAQVDPSRRSATSLLFTAHSLPQSMATNCRYVTELEETSRLVANALELPSWRLAFQSRSGPPSQPWLEPDVSIALRKLTEQGERDVVIVPVGFLSDHVEVLFDLDVEARREADSLGINMVRAKTVGTHPAMIAMIRELILERIDSAQPPRALGCFGPSPNVCPVDCCLPRG